MEISDNLVLIVGGLAFIIVGIYGLINKLFGVVLLKSNIYWPFDWWSLRIRGIAAIVLNLIVIMAGIICLYLAWTN